MGSLSNRLRRLERDAEQLQDTLRLEDGSVVHVMPGERLDALLAALDDEPHDLHAALQRLHPDASATDHELAELLEALGVGEA